MTKIRKEKTVYTINKEIADVQISRFANDFKKAMRKDLIFKLIKLATIATPIVLTTLSFHFFKSPVIHIICVTATAGVSVGYVTVEFIKYTKDLIKESKHDDSIIDIKEKEEEDPEKEVERILNKGAVQSKGSDYYRDHFKSYLIREENRKETEDERKYREAVERITDSSKIYRPKEDNDYHLNKEETMIQLIREIDLYTDVYKVPPRDITNEQWDIFFDIVYKLFKTKGIEDDFYDAMKIVVRYTFAKVIVDEKKIMTISDYIDNLDYLESDKISKKDINGLKESLNNIIKTKKVISFTKYKKEKNKTKKG